MTIQPNPPTSSHPPSNDFTDPIFGSLDRRRRARNMTPGQRKKAERDAKRTKATYDLPWEIIEGVSAISARESIPASQIVALLIARGLEDLAQGKLDLDDFKTPTRSPRFEWVLDLPGKTITAEIELLREIEENRKTLNERLH